MAVMYTIEPLLGQLYTTRAIRAMENVLSCVRKEVFRVLLMQPISFFDKHSPTDLSNILAVELDSLRSFAFGYAPPLLAHLGVVALSAERTLQSIMTAQLWQSHRETYRPAMMNFLKS